MIGTCECKPEQLAAIKINLKSLADEARHNRLEASRLVAFARWKLNHHRTTVIRPEARAAHLLYAFCRGIPRNVVEGTRRGRDARGWPHGHDYMVPERQLLNRIRQKATKLGVDYSDLSEWFHAE